MERDIGSDGNLVVGSTGHRQQGDLHQLALRLVWNHPSGFFAGTEGAWAKQDAEGAGRVLAAADFWQWHARVGWRSPRRRVEASAALLNILDETGGLHPINLHASPLTERTVALSLRLNF